MTDKNPDFEREKWKCDLNRSAAERAHDNELSFFSKANEAAVNSANHTLRALIIVNGGAAIAMLAFIGHLMSIENGRFANKLSDITAPLIWFAWGVALATLAVGLSYIVNYSISAASWARDRQYDHPFIRETPKSHRWLVVAYIFQIAAIFLGITSLAFFVLGMFKIQSVIDALH